MTLTHIELFAGISGFGLGFSRSGIQTLAHVEIDPACRVLLRRHDPDSIILDDVRTAGAHNLPYADIISFGSPCQDLSVAGKRKGLAGERSGLFHEAIRIVSELRPAFAVWENVPGAFSSNAGRDFAHVLAAFHECGAVDIAWATLDAQHFGVAQRRRRVFVVADFRGDRAGEILFIPESGSRNPEARRATWQGTAATTEGGTGSGSKPAYALKGSGNWKDDGADNLVQTYRMQRSDDYENDSIASTLAARDFKSATDLVAFNVTFCDANGVRKDRPNGGLYVNETHQANILHAGNPSEQTMITIGLSGELNASDDLIGTITTPSPSGGGKHAMVYQKGVPNAGTSETNTRTILRILRNKAGAEAFTEWGLGILNTLQQAKVLQPKVYGTSIRPATDQNGTAMVDSTLPRTEAGRSGFVRTVWSAGCVGRASQRWGLDEQQSRKLRTYLSCLSQQGTPQKSALRDLWEASEGLGVLRETLSAFQEVWRPSHDQGQPAYISQGVRRLTPLEAERLQGFPDGYTAGQSDSTRYRQLGNAVCVNVAAWLGKRIAEAVAASTGSEAA